MTGPCHCLNTVVCPQILLPNGTSLTSGAYKVALMKQMTECVSAAVLYKVLVSWSVLCF